MNLTDEQKADVLGLVSGFGTSESEVKARRLVETDAKAAAYFRATKAIAHALELSAQDKADEQLSDREVDEITKVVLRRATGNTVGRSKRSRKWLLGTSAVVAGAAAAAVLLVCSIWLDRLPGPLSAGATERIDVLFVAKGRHVGADPPEHADVLPGHRIETDMRLARFVLSDETIVVLNVQGSVRTSQDRQSLTVERGEVFIVCGTTISVHLPEVTIDLRTGRMLVSVHERGVYLYLYDGTAEVRTADETHELSAGQEVGWHHTERTITIRPPQPDVPPTWAESVLGIETHP